MTVRKPFVFTALVLGALALCASREARAQSRDSNTITRYQLANGLDVVLEERRDTPRVAVQVEYRVGMRDQLDGYGGLAHLTEHVMFSWARANRRGGVAFLETVGASSFNGQTSPDSTRYYEIVSASALERAIAFESDRMGFLLDHVGQRALASEISIVLRENAENVNVFTIAGLGPALLRSLYGAAHPYRFLFEDPAQVAGLELDDVRWFHQRWYAPSNATLVLVGDFETNNARSLIQRYFGGLATVPRPARAAAPPIRTPSERPRFFARSTAASDSFWLIYPSPALFAEDDAELDILSDALTRGRTARLPRVLDAMPELACTVVSQQSSLELASTFQIRGQSRAGGSESVLTVTDAMLAELRSTEIPQSELEALRARRLLSMRQMHQTLEGRAFFLGLYARRSASIDAMLARDFDRYLSVTPATVRRAASRWLDANKRILVLRSGTPRAQSSPRTATAGGSP